MNWYKIKREYEDNMFMASLIKKYQKKLLKEINAIMDGQDTTKDPKTFTGFATRYGL